MDEIGDMGAELQVKLLRVLEERQFEQVGGAKTIHVDVRVLAATHCDLDEAVQKGDFREDLYYRLYVIPIMMPPLKERKADIPALIDHFIVQMNRAKNRQVRGVSAEVSDLLVGYLWPGNVRELKNLVERLVVLGGEGTIALEDLPTKFKSAQRRVAVKPDVPISDDGFCLATEVTAYERQLIQKTLEKANWVKNRAAKLLNVNRTTLVEKIKRYKLHKNS